MLVFHQWPYTLVRLPCYSIGPWSLGCDHGYILHTLYMIHDVTKVGSAHWVPASDSDVGAERTGGSIQVVVGLSSRRPPEWIFVAERQGRLRHPVERWPGPGRCPRLFHNNTLNEFGYLIWVWPFGLYALTSYVGIVMGTRRRGISRSLLDVSDLAARAGLDRVTQLP